MTVSGRIAWSELATDYIFDPRARRDVAISGTVDHDLRQIGLPAGFVFHDHAAQPAVFHQRRRHPGIQKQGRARCLNELGGRQLVSFRIPWRHFGLDQAAALADALIELARKAMRAVKRNDGQGHQRPSRRAAQCVGALQQKCLRAGARRTGRRRHAGDAATAHDHIELTGDWYFL